MAAVGAVFEELIAVFKIQFVEIRKRMNLNIMVALTNVAVSFKEVGLVLLKNILIVDIAWELRRAEQLACKIEFLIFLTEFFNIQNK